MRPSLSKKAELMFPRSKENRRSSRSTLSLPVVFSRLTVNLGCLLDLKLSLHVYRKTDASHSRAPCPSRLPQQHREQGTKNRAAETLLPASVCFELAIEHYLSRTLLWPPCRVSGGLTACSLFFLLCRKSCCLRSQTGNRGQGLQALWLKKSAWGRDERAGKRATSHRA